MAATCHRPAGCLAARSPLVGATLRARRVVPFQSLAQRPAASPINASPRDEQGKTSPSSDFAPQLSIPMLATLFTVLAEGAASAVELEPVNPFGGVQANSLYVTLILFLMSVPGIYSLVKRAPSATKKRMTFEVLGPASEGAMSLDDRARQIFGYFKRYNYSVKATGEVITFEGIYAADKGQAAALVFYVFFGMASVALVLSILVPSVGNWWYGLTAVSPAAYFYYMQKGTRAEEFKVKMVTSDDEKTTDIVVEGDKEEIERFWKELGLVEKGKVLVKGMLAA
ncbi:hypothetical protein HYH03_012450 [Edaphochlamys debaryana]|uniref:Uncharacterized protein n=1 Tax=Edaphochlamys debaryana TaxID=47281 RepID=A0A836BTX6_9CHLO|nr:hypothetical protein HYH03_012450 [Edaphochlamys debaryana]|eukprot:KAG2489011.1 hypothetical protein HYH03_012450 [Edaphochlamys debaryana]